LRPTFLSGHRHFAGRTGIYFAKHEIFRWRYQQPQYDGSNRLSPRG